MKFTPAKFSALFADGVLEMDGWAFVAGKRQLIAHLARPEMRPVDKYWHVSERTTGFPVGMATAPTRNEAARRAVSAMALVNDQKWQQAITFTVVQRLRLPVPKASK